MTRKRPGLWSFPWKGNDVAKPSRFVIRTALCGHEYQEYSFIKSSERTHCEPCMRTVRAGWLKDKRAREIAANLVPSPPGFSISKARRFAIYERDEWICQLCLENVDPMAEPGSDWSASLDHIICQSWTTVPDHSDANLRLAHKWCNSVRGNERYYTVADLRLPAA